METQEIGKLEIAPVTGEAPGLEGVHGRVRIEIGGRAVATVTIDGTHVQLTPAQEGEADAVFRFEQIEDLAKLLRGELNPVVASLQDLFGIEGDLAFSVKVFLGLQVPSDFRGQRLQGN
jgi:hypothetical protein